MRIRAKVKDDKGDVQELVVDRPVASSDGSEGRGSMRIGAAVNALFKELVEELDRAGLSMPAEEQDATVVKLTLALLHDQSELTVKAVFKPSGETPAPEKPEEGKA